jgi:hypothetical protein
MRYLFVGEKRSPTAIRMGVTWEDGRLCAKNLHEALVGAGIDPSEVTFANLWRDDGALDGNALYEWLPRATRWWGVTIVALGVKVQAVLEQHDIPHIKLCHPAARGSIRKRERYQAHVREVLGGEHV